MEFSNIVIESYEDWINVTIEGRKFFTGHSMNCNDIAELLRKLGHDTELQVLEGDGNIEDESDFRGYDPIDEIEDESSYPDLSQFFNIIHTGSSDE